MASKVCTIEDDFTGTNEYVERIRYHPDINNFVPIEGAAVPEILILITIRLTYETVF